MLDIHSLGDRDPRIVPAIAHVGGSVMLLAAIAFGWIAFLDGTGHGASVARAAGLHGDAELLRLAAVEQTANLEKLRTWSAKVAITNETRNGDELWIKTTNTVDFVYDQKEGVRWDWLQEFSHNKRGGVEEPLPPQFSAAGARSTKEGASYYREAPVARGSEEAERITAYVSPDNRSVPQGITSRNFNPIFFYRRDGMDIAERFLFFHALAKKKDLETVTVDREGPLITLELDVTPVLNRYVVDLGRGGNLVRYFAEESGGPGAGIEEEWTYEYEQLAGVWVPKLITLRRTSANGRNSLNRESRWLKNEVNGAVAPDQFTLQAVGVEQGERVHDNRGPVVYTYGESPGRAPWSRGSWLWLANLAFLAVVALYVLVRRRRAR